MLCFSDKTSQVSNQAGFLSNELWTIATIKLIYFQCRGKIFAFICIFLKATISGKCQSNLGISANVIRLKF